ncbi:glycoside hydrolase family 3 protein [Phaffia rhodozyma]|uniref:beta-glucosidase n=1 Tax=Phaffia rhodozyma TaxID=264483 RepID=A0A0F7SH02_PHARH|nr:glycoside hydrolase family 3 protein [Phaffia rhodozyma]
MMSLVIEDTLSKLSMLEKIKLLSGSDAWHTYKIDRLGIPAVRMSDGPNGVRGTNFFNGTLSSCFPCSTGVASSWDVDLVREIGLALGTECKEKGAHVLLGPTVNTQRSPLGGRGFESFSEDPYLNGTIAAAYINGVQEKGVVATIKHFVCNDQEKERQSIDSVLSERALREIYLKPFQIAIKDSDPQAVMTSYNRVNGIHVSEDYDLLENVLRKEWGYKGLIMSDWTGVYSTDTSIKAGLDVEMPGPGVMRSVDVVQRAITAGKLSIEDLDARVLKVLELVQKAQTSGIPFDVKEKAVDTPELRDLLRRSAADAIVLLKNEDSLLPLTREKLASRSIKSIGVIGPNVKLAYTSGGGSAQLLSTYTVTPFDGIRSAVKEVLGQDQVPYALGASSHRFLPLASNYIKNGKIEFWNEPFDKDGKQKTEAVYSVATTTSTMMLFDNIVDDVNMICWHRYSGIFVPDEDGDWEFGIVIAGQGDLYIDGKLVVDNTHNQVPGEYFFNQGSIEVKAIVPGLKSGKEYSLELRSTNEKPLRSTQIFGSRGALRVGAWRTIQEKEAIQEAVDVARNVDAVVLVIGLNQDWESEGYDRANMDLPGATNDLVRSVLDANPNVIIVNQSGTPVEMPWIDDASTVLQAFYGGNELGNGMADVLFGKRDVCGKLPLSFPKNVSDNPSFISFPGENGKVIYNEGIYVGYRHPSFEPLFAFGHGLTYSAAEYSSLSLPSKIGSDGTFDVSFTVRNAGNVAMREIAQVYVSDRKSSLPRPEKELKGFTKISLKPGQSIEVTLTLEREALGYWDDQKHHWAAEQGEFEIRVGGNSTKPTLKGTTELERTIVWTGL